MSDAALPVSAQPPRERFYRHRLLTRITHWINFVCLLFLAMSGLQILRAHPMLYWGQFGANFDTPWIGFETIPEWLTVPSYQDLSGGRYWHFFFAWVFVINGLVYLIGGLINRHIQRDLLPTGEEIKPRHILQDIGDHLRLKFPKGEAAKRYNVLQKLAYLGVIILLPLMLFTGLTMSPGMNAVAPWMLDVVGGRQSGRSLHFICFALIVLFVVVHLVMVVLSGPINEIRSMITGRYEIEPEDAA